MAFPMIFLWSALAPLLASVFLVPSGTGPATQPLTTAGARGTLVQLSQGRVHYDLDLAEPGDDGAAPPLAVFVHGFSLDMTVWDKTAPVVRQQGWSTICLDLYGRGYSDAPGSHQTAELFVGQLAELLLVVAPHSHMVLIGESMGGAIVAKFAQTYPQLVTGAVLVAPAGLPVPLPVAAQLAKLPVIGELAVASNILERELLKHVDRSFANHEDPAAQAGMRHARERLQANQANHPGLVPSLLSTMRHFPMSGLTETYDALGRGAVDPAGHRVKVPLLVVWGDRDVVVPWANHKELLRRVPHAEFVALEGAGHADHHTSSNAKFEAAVLAFLNKMANKK
eukprot:m.390966 g.390966  ORF g.390966 m.390966 type:complete len:339 (+) comp20079_c0_seq3:125-1141(+)